MSNLDLTEDQKEHLGIKDERIDFYFKVENATIDEAGLFSNVYESHLYIILSRYCNNNQIAFPSYSKLAELCYCSRSTIIKCMTSLEEKGYINKLKRKNDNRKINDTNLYTINNIKEYIEVTSEKKNKMKGGSVSDTLGVVHQVHQGSPSDTPYKELTIKNNIIKKTTTRISKEDSTSEIKLVTPKKLSSSFFEISYLEKVEYSKLNLPTKKNIIKTFPELDEAYFKKIYEKVLKLELEGSINSFNGFLFKALKDNWELGISNLSDIPEDFEFTEKLIWLRSSFSGVDSTQYLELIKKIPFEILKQKRKKLGQLSSYDFVKELKKISLTLSN